MLCEDRLQRNHICLLQTFHRVGERILPAQGSLLLNLTGQQAFPVCNPMQIVNESSGTNASYYLLLHKGYVSVSSPWLPRIAVVVKALPLD